MCDSMSMTPPDSFTRAVVEASEKQYLTFGDDIRLRNEVIDELRMDGLYSGDFRSLSKLLSKVFGPANAHQTDRLVDMLQRVECSGDRKKYIIDIANQMPVGIKFPEDLFDRPLDIVNIRTFDVRQKDLKKIITSFAGVIGLGWVTFAALCLVLGLLGLSPIFGVSLSPWFLLFPILLELLRQFQTPRVYCRLRQNISDAEEDAVKSWWEGLVGEVSKLEGNNESDREDPKVQDVREHPST